MTNRSLLSGLLTSICHWSFVIGHLTEKSLSQGGAMVRPGAGFFKLRAQVQYQSIGMARANYLQSHRKPDGCCATRHARRGISREIEGVGERNPVDGFHLHTPHFARRLPTG